MKVGLTLNDELLQKIDDYADENYMSRSTFVSLACTNYLNQVSTGKALKELVVLMRKVAETGHLSDEQMESLRDMERLVNVCYER